MDSQEHWEQVYSTRLAEKLGWYKPRLETSMAWIEELDIDKGAPIIDVGGGASTLVDDLVDAGYESITVLDVSEGALALSRKRLGRQSDLVMWLGADITSYLLPPARFELWHDRGLLHFLVEPDHQQAYRTNLLNTLKQGGDVIIGTFSPDAPEKCSGMPVQRYGEDELAEFLGEEFNLVRHENEMHITPGGVEQKYLYCQFRRR